MREQFTHLYLLLNGSELDQLIMTKRSRLRFAVGQVQDGLTTML